MKALTIRGVDAHLARALEKEQARRGTSLNQAVLDLLRQALGVSGEGPRSNGLAKLAGTWSAEELEEFEVHTESFEQVDEDLWR